MLARRGVPQQSLRGLPSPARTRTPTHALCTTGSPPPSPLSAPTHTPPPPGNFPHQFKGIQPIHPSTPFSNKQSNEQTHTASQKPKQKPPHLNLSAGPPLTALPQSSVPPCSPWPSALPSALPSPLFRHYPQAPPSCPGPFPHEPLWAPFLTSFRSHVLRGPHPPPSSPFTTTNQKPKTNNKNHHHRSSHQNLP